MHNFFTAHVTREIQLEDQARLQRFAEAWRYYYGEHPDVIRVEHGKRNPNVKPNYARLIVDASVSHLFGTKDLGFEIVGKTEREGNDRTPEEQWLDEVMEHNDKMVFYHRLGTNGSVCGHAFYKIVLEGDALPRLCVLDPGTVKVHTDPHDLTRVVRYEVEYSGKDPGSGQARDYRQVIEQNGAGWKITEQEKGPDAPEWTTIATPPWAYPFPPIDGCQNLPSPNEFWGVADLEMDKIHLNRAINFQASNISKIIEIHGHPRTWARGLMREMKIDTSVENLIILPGDNAELQNLEMVGDLGSHIEYLRWVLQALHETARIPEVATGKVDNIGQLSGLALQILYGPIKELTGTKQLTYGGLIKRLHQRLLVIGKFGDGYRTKLHWPEVVPTDATTELQAALLKQEVGFSKDTTITELGGDPEKERQKRQEEAEEAVDQLIPNPLDGLGGGKQQEQEEE